MLPGDMPPHDEEDGSTDEAELNGAREEEGCAVLHQLERFSSSYSCQESWIWSKTKICVPCEEGA